MAVAEKKPGAQTASKPLPVPIASLLGVGYVIGCLALLYLGLPLLWEQLGLSGEVTKDKNVLALGALKAFGTLAAIVILFLVGLKLLGPSPRPGVKAGIFTAMFLLFVWVLLSRWIGGILEGWTHDEGWLAGLGPTAGMGIFAVVSVLILFWFAKIFFRPTFQKRMVRFDGQGWFTFGGYKPGQGLKIRRGTMLGILLVAGSGIWVMMNNTLEKGDWTINTPFTGEAEITDSGSAFLLSDLTPEQEKGLRAARPGKNDKGDTVPGTPYRISRAELKELEARVAPGVSRVVRNPELFADYVLRGLDKKYLFDTRFVQNYEFFETYQKKGLDKLKEYKLTRGKEITGKQFTEISEAIETFEEGKGAPKEDITKRIEDLKTAAPLKLVTGDQFQRALDAIKKVKSTELKDRPKAEQDEEVKAALLEARQAAPVTQPITSSIQYSSLLVMPNVTVILPLVLIVVSLWFAWRVINLPVFADFLIATEAEMNKVSWTTRSKLYQDTIVVLVTVVLFATFFLVVDFVWVKVLSWKPVSVLKLPDETDKKETDERKMEW